jgi:hypothetical protein
MSELRPPTYLVELLSGISGELLEAEVYARLDTAVEKAAVHAKSELGPQAHASVSLNVNSEIDGVGFFDDNQNLVACVTVYRLEHDAEAPTVPELQSACEGSADSMQTLLNAFLTTPSN